MAINKNEEMRPLYEQLRDEYNNKVFYFDSSGVPIWLTGVYAGKRRGRVNVLKSGYTRYQIGMNLNGKRYQVMVHRLRYFIETSELADGFIDHINCKPKDNRPSNLRKCTPKQNLRNLPPRKGTASKFKGVCKNSNSGKPWKIAVTDDHGVNVHGGYFDDEIKAALAYDKLAREYYGEFAWLNFPNIN